MWTRENLRAIALDIRFDILDQKADKYDPKKIKVEPSRLSASNDNYEVLFRSDTIEVKEKSSCLQMQVKIKKDFTMIGIIRDDQDFVGFSTIEKISARLGNDEAIPKFKEKMEEMRENISNLQFKITPRLELIKTGKGLSK